jgi:hypothetical protein
MQIYWRKKIAFEEEEQADEIMTPDKILIATGIF